MSPYYKGMKVDLLGLPISDSNKSDRVKRKNRKRNFYHISFDSPFQKNSPKNLLLMYDVPYTMKKERDWFRRHLVKFGYIMIQKSVWVGAVALAERILGLLEGNKDRG